MALMTLGVNYQTAPIQVRERFAFDFAKGADTSRWLVDEGHVAEAVVVSTCHRTELYCEGDNPFAILQFLVGHLDLSYEWIQPHVYIHQDLAVVKHLMRVASGLDSMVLGEAEILGQVKKAYMASLNAGAVGKCLSRLFQTTFSVAKRVRTNTGIGFQPVSVAYAAARLSQHIFSDLSLMVVLLVGAGDLIQLTAQHLVGIGVKKIIIANRTIANAIALQQNIECEVISLAEIPEKLVYVDMIITGTGSTLPIVTHKMIEVAFQKRKRRPLLMVDLGVPRNIDPRVAECEDVYLYGVDDLHHIVEENRRARKREASLAESMITDASEQFIHWRKAQGFFTTLLSFRNKYEKIRDQMVEESLHRLKYGEKPEEVLQKMAYRLTNRFLHEPTRRLRTAGACREETLLALTKDLFELS